MRTVVVNSQGSLTSGLKMTTEEHLLTLLSEECAKVSQRACKAQRLGLASGQLLSNAERVRQGFGDLCAVYEMVGLNPPSRASIEAKKASVAKFLACSTECGEIAPIPHAKI